VYSLQVNGHLAATWSSWTTGVCSNFDQLLHFSYQIFYTLFDEIRQQCSESVGN